MDDLHEVVRNNGHSPLTADAHGPEYILDDMDNDELLAYGRSIGVNWSTKQHQGGMARARATAQKHAPQEPPRLAQWLQSVIIGAGNLSLLAIMFTIQAIVLPFSVVALPIAERARVRSGIAMFDPDNALMMSTILVIFMVGLLFVQVKRGGKAKHVKPSLRLLRDEVFYFCGLGKRWKRQTITEDDMLQGAIAWTNRLVVLLGTVGTLQDEIALHAAGKPWLAGLQAVATQSDFNTLLSMIGALVLTATLLFGNRYVVAYNYHNFVALRDSVAFFGHGSAAMEAAENAEREYILTQIIRAKQRQAFE